MPGLGTILNCVTILTRYDTANRRKVGSGQRCGETAMTSKLRHGMIPYNKEEDDIYSGLCFNPDEPEPLPDAMYQETVLREIMYLLAARFSTTGLRSDVFLSSNTFICYDRSNLNIRVGPDCYLAFGVDAAAIRARRLYLPWEAGKMPDFALEVASETTAESDGGQKRELYRRLGVGEYWRFDRSGGEYYGEPLIGERLVNGRYQRLEIRREDDGPIRGYSPTLDLFLSWEVQDEQGWLCFYDPATGLRLPTYQEVLDFGQIAEARADAAEAEVRELREQLRRLREP